MKNSTLFCFVFICLLLLVGWYVKHEARTSDDRVTIAILAKSAAHCLPLYLSCIEKQTWPKNKTNLYIRTNNNTDNTLEVLEKWLKKVRHLYAKIYFDASDVSEQVQRFGSHDWNSERFNVLGRIRQASVDWASEHTSHYFVADCDNFIKPHTLETLMNTNLPVVAPLLHRGSDPRADNARHVNFYASEKIFDANREWLFVEMQKVFDEECPLQEQLVHGEIKGLIQVPVVHCTYLIRNEVLKHVVYVDGSGDWEFRVFSKTMWEHGVSQYLDNREVYGYLTDAESGEGLKRESFFHDIAFLSSHRLT